MNNKSSNSPDKPETNNTQSPETPQEITATSEVNPSTVISMPTATQLPISQENEGITL